MRIFICFLVFCFFYILLTNTASAHTGGGPPFVLVNGKYAITSPLFLGSPTENGLNIPQDIAPERFLINKDITLAVDTTQLSIDPSVTENLEFRWSFSNGPNLANPTGKVLTGTEIKTQFTQPSSYLVTLKSNPSGNEFIILDTILINIFPNADYSLPKTTITILSGQKSGTNTTFSASSTHSNSTYLWDFSENKTEKGTAITKTFEQLYFYTPLIIRNVSDGFIADSGIIIVGDKGEISFSLIDPNVDPQTLIIKKPGILSQSAVTITIISIIITVSAILVFLLRRKK